MCQSTGLIVVVVVILLGTAAFVSAQFYVGEYKTISPAEKDSSPQFANFVARHRHDENE